MKTIQAASILLVSFFLFSSIFAAPAGDRQKVVGAKQSPKAKQAETTPPAQESAPQKKLSPQLSLAFSPSLPVGYMRDTFPVGFGGVLSGSISLYSPWDSFRGKNPFNVSWIAWRAGVSSGFFSFAATERSYSSRINFLPFTADLRAVFLVPQMAGRKMFPYLNIGNGIAWAASAREENTTGTTSSANSVDYIFSANLGISWQIPRTPFRLFAESGYGFAAESNSGHFVNFLIGESYAF